MAICEINYKMWGNSVGQSGRGTNTYGYVGQCDWHADSS